VWVRTLQSAQVSKATYLPLGLDASKPRKKADLLLVTVETVRASQHQGLYFSLEPLLSRERAGADSFLDDDGLFTAAEFGARCQESEAAGREDRRPVVGLANSSATCFPRHCLLPNDHYKVHLHGDPHRAVTIPTIITVRQRAQARKQSGMLAEKKQPESDCVAFGLNRSFPSLLCSGVANPTRRL
jgi:hypothetical protein